MEQRQQQMMSFLAKAMQRPGFLAQIVQQKNNGSRHVTGVDKKRRLPNNDEENFQVGIVNRACSDGQIVKCQPFINEAGKLILREILKLSEPLHDRLKNPNAFLLDHVPATSNATDYSHSSTQTSGATLFEVSQCSKQPIFPEEKVFSSNHAMISTVHSSHPARRAPAKEVQIPEGNMCRSQEDSLMSDSSLVPGMLSQGSYDTSISKNQNPDLGFMDALSAVQNGTLPTEGKVYSPGHLPVSVDNFWEQFFSILPENTEEVNSSSSDASFAQELELAPAEEWENHHPVSHLTEQMGLLTAMTEKV